MAGEPNGSAPTPPHFLPESVWRELRGLLDPAGHFFGEFKLVIHDGHLAFTEKISKFRTPAENKQ